MKAGHMYNEYDPEYQDWMADQMDDQFDGRMNDGVEPVAQPATMENILDYAEYEERQAA